MKTHFKSLIVALALFAALHVQAQVQCYNQTFMVTDTIVPACDHDGQINISVSGGTAPYTFSWNHANPNIVISTSQNLTNASGGYYSVTILDANNNCSYHWFYMPPPFNVHVNTTPDNCPNHDGTATVTASGGALPYSYLWSNGGVTTTISNLTGGSYDVTVSDGNGCRLAYSELDSNVNGAMVYFQDSVRPNTSTTPSTCHINDGSMTVTSVSNGTSPYTYAWGNYQGQTWNTQTVSNIPPGYYGITVTDANGCQGQSYAYLQFNSAIQISPTSTDENCMHHNGTATVVGNGTTGPYTYIWSTGATTSTITGLNAGSYSVTVHDGNGCDNSTDVYVNRYSPVNPNLTSTDEICPSTSGGSAQLAPGGGTGPYTYHWDDGATTQSVTGLALGYHAVTVTDANQCTAYGWAYIQHSVNITPVTAITQQNCPALDGTISLTPIGGTAPYTFIWSNGATTASLSGLAAGDYEVSITDQLGCSMVDYLTVPYSSGFGFSSINTSPETCTQQNGTATIYLSGGTSPFTYLWSNGGNTQTITGLSTGGYAVTVTDHNGCSVAKVSVVGYYSPVSVSVNVTPATCIFTNDGSATATISNGTPPYTYWWGNGSQTAVADSLHANWGIGVQIVDAHGCVSGNYVNNVGYRNLSCASILQGNIVDDANLNCTTDIGEVPLEGTVVTAIPSGFVTLTNATGDYQLVVPPGNQAITQHAEFRQQECPDGSITLNNTLAGSTYTGNNFYDTALNVEDLRISSYAYDNPHPGRAHSFRIYYYNQGLHTVNPTIEFTYDANDTYTGNYLPYGVNGNVSVNTGTRTVTISLNNIMPNNGNYIFYNQSYPLNYVDLDFLTSVNAVLGNTQTYNIHISPDANDVTPPNNTEVITQPVTAAYDPNELVVTPKGTGLPGYISTGDSTLKYEIHFQNTGTFSASYVAIRDTLDANLDINTVLKGASSHPCRMQIMDKNVLVFLFDPISLADSGTSQELSKGIVVFYIKQKKGLSAGAEIHNKAAIYFDFNIPVITNGVLNTLNSSASINEVQDKVGMKLLPNPSTGSTNLLLDLREEFNGDVQVTDLPGKEIMVQHVNLQAGSQNIPLNFEGQAVGIYMIHLRSGNVSQTVKFVKQ